MHLDKDAQIKFKKLGVKTISQLALLTPASYEDYRLNNTLFINKAQLIDATIKSVYRSKNSIQITFFAHNFNQTIFGVIFRPKPYMLHQYKEGSRGFFYGVIECEAHRCSMSMPKIVKDIGSITPKYKTALRNDVMKRLVAKYLTKEALKKEGIKNSVIDCILTLHFPQNGFCKESVWALKYLELFDYMKQLSFKRKYFPAIKSIDNSYMEWVNRLEFKLTPEQLKAINDIADDLKRDIASKRMIVGDVGSGKTMVILATAYINRGNYTILMAPTTILANQLYEEARKFLPNIKSVLVTNKTKKVDLKEYDFIIGTHALLYRDLPQATVVMVDEQHRFGTMQRNQLEKLVTSFKKRPHYFQFSATPIPRTQAMIETAHIDVSLITSTPFKKDITSKVIRRENFKDLLKHIRSELDKNNQVLIIYPLVSQSEVLEYQSIEEARGYWEKNFQDVYVTHGKDKDKEQVLLDFREKGKILIATTVVEVGISLPRLSTIVIVGAERLGLSTLHQLRGRVSRTGLKGYCFLYTNQKESKRLEAFINSTNGFDIANLDLKFRKSGDLLTGINQSGDAFKFVDLSLDEEIVKEVKKDLL